MIEADCDFFFGVFEINLCSINVAVQQSVVISSGNVSHVRCEIDIKKL